MNYTGLRTVDSDFEYVSAGDVNKNGLIDAYDISIVTTQLDGGVRTSATDQAEGTIAVTPGKTSYKAGDELRLTVSGKNLKCVNALSFALPYSTAELEYQGVELLNMKEMVNLTYDRLHSNGQKELFPTFVNRGNNFLLEDGDLFVIKFKAYEGWTNLNTVAGEMKRPKRDLPLAIIISMGGIMLIYTLFNFAVYRIIPQAEVNSMIADGNIYLGKTAAFNVMGNFGKWIVLIGMAVCLRVVQRPLGE